ncbi:hypothetical protein B0H63DRAFT_510591 [Podospora didyma]|uniref:Uncharacterized protein n=1 Tax=Podospora didyma TaxID=330526 RepID=A0AAE0NQN9_9PEZI|nr:hypothetical protein B0H63DRAFT_510591 [Podospora didyma]
MSSTMKADFSAPGPCFDTNVTPTAHGTSYPAIDPTRPELSQAGKTVLIVGGTSGIGLAIAKGFIAASASAVIIAGRGQEQLDIARASLEQEAAAKANRKETRIIAERSDAADLVAIDALWSGLAARGIVVDVLVFNTVKTVTPGPLLTLGTQHVWEGLELSVRSLLRFAEKLNGQENASDGTKYLLNVSTAAVNTSHKAYFPMTAERPEYALAKGAAALALQFVAQDVDPEQLQVISFHPGTIFTPGVERLGIPANAFPFDDESLPGSFAVWAASEEARFLHGRWVWASWDVTELAQGELRKRLDSEVDFLRISVGGLAGTNLA